MQRIRVILMSTTPLNDPVEFRGIVKYYFKFQILRH